MDPLALERVLVARARRGGPDGRQAFRDLVIDHQAWLTRYVFYVLGSMDQADDVVQEVFIRAYSALDGYRGESGLRPWLRTIATRLAFNHRRDQATRSRVEGQAAQSELLPPVGGAFEAREALLGTLAELPYPYREILVLRFVEELSVGEIAETLVIGLSAAKMRLKRAREAFEVSWTNLVNHAPS